MNVAHLVEAVLCQYVQELIQHYQGDTKPGVMTYPISEVYMV